MKKIISLFIIIVSVNISAQVGIGVANANPSAMLEVFSTAKGFLPPRMTTAQRDAINGGNFTEGLVIYNTDVHCFQFWNASRWISRCDGSSSGSKNSNSIQTLISGAPSNGINGQKVNDNGETLPKKDE